MSRREALPDAETPSYWPVFISCTISSDVLPIFTFTLHPVCCWNGPTQLTFGSFAPLSAYPAQAMMLSAPSPAPMDCSIAPPGSCGAAVLEPAELDGLLVLELELLHAPATSTTVAVSATPPMSARIGRVGTC